jgi:carboxyl-terminal processing protease
VYDPHTLYMAPADKENFDIQMTGSLEGIGAVLSEDDHFIVVREVVPGGASWRQGQLAAGDLILAVAQEGKEPVDVTDMRINEVVKMIRGPKGTVVTLTVKKPDDEVELITITRDVIVIEAAYARGALLKLGSKDDKVGYIYLSRFYGDTRSRRARITDRNATDDVRALLDRFSARKVSGIVLDLRGNGGGLLDHARDISGLFIETGPIVQTRFGDGDLQVLADEDAGVSYEGSVVVLVDRFSASASEILAGALQDYKRAVIVGTGPTHGKGTVQVLLDLDRMVRGSDKPLGVLKLTIQQYFRVNGESTQSRGVVPDIVLPDAAEHIESGERYLDNAIPWSAAKPLAHETWPGAAWHVTALAEASKARRAGHAAFEAIDARAAYLQERAKQTLVPLGREAWLARRKRDRDKLEKLDPELAKGPARFTVEVVSYAKGGGAVTDPNAAKAAAVRLELWQKALARDPWVEEAVHIVTHIVTDMAAAR